MQEPDTNTLIVENHPIHYRKIETTNLQLKKNRLLSVQIQIVNGACTGRTCGKHHFVRINKLEVIYILQSGN